MNEIEKTIHERAVESVITRIKERKHYFSIHPKPKTERQIAVQTYILEALREKAERDTEAKRRRTEQKPQPLTIEELQEFIDSDEEDSAIWVKDIEYDHFTRALLDWDRDRRIFAIWHGDKDTSDFPIEKDYGKTWLAYRTKPEWSEE